MGRGFVGRRGRRHSVQEWGGDVLIAMGIAWEWRRGRCCSVDVGAVSATFLAEDGEWRVIAETSAGGESDPDGQNGDADDGGGQFEERWAERNGEEEMGQGPGGGEGKG